MSNRPRGYFEKALVIDCETSGIFMNSDLPDLNIETKEYYQPVSWGLIVVDQKFKTLEELYVEIKWDSKSLWDSSAEAVHGLSKDYLAVNGLDEEEAVITIADLLLRHWGPTLGIVTGGHNIGTFDIHYFRRMFARHGVNVRLNNRVIDTFSLGHVTMGAYNSDELFSLIGCPERDPAKHNALDDARNSLKVIQVVREIWDHAMEY